MGAYEFHECVVDEECTDPLDPCDGDAVCVDGFCSIVFLSDCNGNDREDMCDLDEETLHDCNANGTPDECGEGSPDIVLIDSTFACDDTLPRTLGHVLRLTFACDITELLPSTGEVKIQELLTGGTFGSDVSSSFTFSVENDKTLRIAENGAVLSNETWYGVVNDSSWTGVADFQMDYVVVYGDADNSGTTDALDANTIWAHRLDPVIPDDSRFDIDADGDIDALDVNASWNNRTSQAPIKPNGHGCTLP